MTPNHALISTQLRSIVLSDPGLPLQVAAWLVREYFDNWTSAYRGVHTGIRHRTYDGIELRTHTETGITMLYPTELNGKPQRGPGRPRIPIDLQEVRRIQRRMKQNGERESLRKIAREMGVSDASLRRSLRKLLHGKKI